MYCVIGLHALLLLAMIPDYFADNDLGFHISLARQYAEHGTYFWDHLNWAPTGRPNLQGPALHFAVGTLGRVLGGTGDNYVLAFSLMAVLQWCVAVFTAVFFARKYGGDWAGLIAAALLTGGVWSAGSFFVGVPSGWIFILTPWAIHFFLQDRPLAAALFCSLVMYVHLGGAPVAPFGVFLVAVVTRRWKGLLVTGTLTAVLTLPYLIHFFRHLDWYNGQRGVVAGSANWLLYALAIPGLVWLALRWRQNLFLLAWAVAPLAWFFQDNLRFLLQSTVCGAAIAGVFVAFLLERYGQRWRPVAAGALVTLATVFPLSIPSLPVELMWATGNGFPRELDWTEARALGEVLEQEGLADRIVTSYYDSLSGAMAIYTPLSQQHGHWGEVRPPVDPARDISVGEKVYVLPVPPEDEVLRDLEARGWIHIHGGGRWTSIATLPRAGNVEEVTPLVADVVLAETKWLADNAVNNRMPPPETLFRGETVAELRQRTREQKAHAGRIQTAILVYGYAIEAVDPDVAREVRRSVRGWGSIANFIGDETALDYVDDTRFERFRKTLIPYGEAVASLKDDPHPGQAVRDASDRLFDEFF